ncbi:MAG: hypothetical protein AAF686_02125, partial [Pseudomonadota bacterium]
GMRVRICCLLIATLTLSACGGWRDSNVNPRNWFGGGGGSVPNTQTQLTPLTPSDRQTGNPLIDDDDSAQIVRANTTPVARSGGLFRRTRQAVYAGTLVDQISDIGVESLPTGRILRVTGAPLREGAFDVRLIEVNPDGPVNGVLEYTLNALQPADFGRGTETTRRVEAAAFISNADLEGVRQIRVRAQRNAQTITP